MYKVLVVEDETLIRKGLIFSIKWAELNCNVIAEASDGQEGVDKIRIHKPDIVITDINMPILTGIQMIKETMEEVAFRAIIITGYDEFDYAKQAIKYGVSEYLLKPVEHEELTQAIHRAIREIEMQKAYQTELLHRENSVKGAVISNEQLQTTSKSVVVARMIETIKEKYMNKIVMSDLAEELECSTTMMNNKFKLETGTTFNDFLNRYRIVKAIELIKEKKYPLYKIAETTGFKNYKYFNLVFNKYIGCSATDFEQASL